ncbi:glycosyltransferase family 2 protein [Capnocytophaga cynodegmi]|uniref:glycosyltransferase family 2 protein n=1 Tax=Capnocytophaga cynodegmi TaxID=28189 RepID=UPI001AC4D0BC|nr:glycosyltransferase family 2 protein [Capnocytophaga cynodegmi]GIM55028.1 hypothetical protein CAPN005_16750 [Capnocytophaga cynodegmi]
MRPIKNDQMLFSVIIPVYNVEKYLPECVNSVLNQNFLDYEMILVNDGSTDNSGNICDEYAKKYSNIKVIHKENGGLSDARNFGIKEAKGDYLMFLDSDDFWQGTNILSDLSKVIENEDPDVILHGFTEYDQTNLKKIVKPLCISPLDLKNDFLKLVQYGIFDFTGCNKIISKKLIDDHLLLFPLGRLHEDIYWCFDILKNMKIISFYQKNFYFYRINRSGAITHKMKIKNITDILDAIKEKIIGADKDYLQLYLVKVYFSGCYNYYSLEGKERRKLLEKIDESRDLVQVILEKNWKLFGRKSILFRFFGVHKTMFFIFKYHKLKSKIRGL